MQTLQNTLPSFSVMIEWENARLSELGRARDMLSTLAAQVGEVRDQLSEPPELIVLYNPAAIDPGLVQSLIDAAFKAQPDIETRLLPTEKGTYYLQKNHGAGLARRDLVMFLDSDVVPERDWLAKLIGSFNDPEITIACGNTYIEANGVYSKAFALFWFFPLRSKTDVLEPSPYFFANNVVFRRDLFLDYKFADVPYLRGQCTDLANALTRDGHKIYIQNAARVSHPPPNGLSHFVKRALCQGHDQLHRTRAAGGAMFPRGSLGRFKRSLQASAQRIRHDRNEVGLGALGAVTGAGIAFAYYSICLAGEAVTHVRPTLIRDKFAV